MTISVQKVEFQGIFNQFSLLHSGDIGDIGFFKQAKTMFIGNEVQLRPAGTQPAALKLVPSLTTYQDHFLDQSG